MKLLISQNDLSINPPLFLRQAGYTYIESRHTGQGSFVRALGRNNYPRFHIYVNEENDKIIFNVHLDQKQPSYGSTSAHSGEYDGEVVEQEVARLKSLVS